ncbi:hypothetical protein [Pedobacter nototheniae]|uniref:hypothetical protein n=1 Tax=Pedobacter nototheniae TaxID=2488994 RepID=UPI002930D544|nr:hypothetical protein [Pedobacter nototheniae]
MTFIAILLISLILALVFFGKPADKRFKALPAMNSAVKWTLVIASIVLSIFAGYIFADTLYIYLLFGVWIFVFLIGLTLLVGIIDLIIKTRYFKIPLYLVFLFILTYTTVIIIKEG